jgi:hypothetical protein
MSSSLKKFTSMVFMASIINSIFGGIGLCQKGLQRGIEKTDPRLSIIQGIVMRKEVVMG